MCFKWNRCWRNDSLVVVGTVTQSGGTNTAGGSVSSNSNTSNVGASITGIYGDLTLNEDGSYSYIANNATSLTDGQTVTDIFTFTVSDTQGGTDTNFNHTVIGQSVALVNDTDTVNEDATVTVADGADEDLLIDDTAVTIITHIQHRSRFCNRCKQCYLLSWFSNFCYWNIWNINNWFWWKLSICCRSKWSWWISSRCNCWWCIYLYCK